MADHVFVEDAVGCHFFFEKDTTIAIKDGVAIEWADIPQNDTARELSISDPDWEWAARVLELSPKTNMSQDWARTAAQAVSALINSRPSSPTVEEIECVIRAATHA